MAAAPNIINHPAFGNCRLESSTVALRWKDNLSDEERRNTLSTLGVTEVTKLPNDEKNGLTGPRADQVNNSAALSFVTGSGKKALSDMSSPNVQWVSPIYRSEAGTGGDRSLFAIEPTTLLLTEAASAALGDAAGLGAGISIDEARTALLHGFIVLKLANADAVQVGQRLMETLKNKGIADAVHYENIPLVSPVCHCTCCSPPTEEHIPNDPMFPDQWGLTRINAPRAWELTEGDPNTIVAVLDEGVELGHPDLNVYPISYSTVTHLYDGSPLGNHGTACAGIIGAHIDNFLGVAGLAGKCRVMAISTVFSDVQVAEGLNFAADNGARVVSMSFGVYPSWMIWDFSIITPALQYATDKNLVLVAATGNENQAVSRFPATDPRTIGVGGSNKDDIRKHIGDTSAENWWGACYGVDCDVVAPCLQIPTTDRLGGLGYTATDYDPAFNGTSSATPHVAALAGLIISLNPGLSNAQVREIISSTCDKISPALYTYAPTFGKPYGTWTNEVGYGRINAERALLLACGGKGKDHDKDEPCEVCLGETPDCCKGPCEPPWRTEDQCLLWYDYKFFREPNREGTTAVAVGELIFRVTYQHSLCLLGRQLGQLLFTVTLLPGETMKLYHYDRYRRVKSSEERVSVHSSFRQSVSALVQTRDTRTDKTYADAIANIRGTGDASISLTGSLASWNFSSGAFQDLSTELTDRVSASSEHVSEQFRQTAVQASQQVDAERSMVISTYEDQESVDTTSRTIHNDNDCHAVTYYVRRVYELYSMSTRVLDVEVNIAPRNQPPIWRSVRDLNGLDKNLIDRIQKMLVLLPKPGSVVMQPRPISLPTDGAVYDAELAHCSSCEPAKEAQHKIELEKQKADAMRACAEAELLALEAQRRRMLLQSGDLSPFQPALPGP